MHQLRSTLIGGAVAAVAILVPVTGASARGMRGTVVEKTTSRSFVVASSTGRLSVVKARRAPRVGRAVSVRGKRVRVLGRRHRARVRGRVAFAGRRTFVVAAHGASLVIDGHARRGAAVTVNVSFGGGNDLDADEIVDHGMPRGGFEVEGVITAVDPAARTITVADDENEDVGDDHPGEHGDGTAIVHVGDAFDLGRFTVGDEVELRVNAGAGGMFELVSLDDHGDRGEPGDDHGDDHGGGGHSGPGRGDDDDRSGHGGDGDD
jgi:RNase P/RNase MRP subunit p29